jgi:gluconolactonase
VARKLHTDDVAEQRTGEIVHVTVEGNLEGILETDQLTTLSEGHRGLEGPVLHRPGHLTFVDLEGNQLLRWRPGLGVDVIRAANAEGNGCTLDAEDRLIMCEGGTRSIVRLEPDGSWTTLARMSEGKRLNRPNDIVRRSDGSFYFTDPNLFVPKEQRDIGTSGVWRLTVDGHLQLVSTDLAFPNGLALSPDERTLYVANSFLDERCLEERKQQAVCRHRYLAAFDVRPTGELRNFREITDMSSNARDVPDGLKVDVNGNIFCTGSGALWVIKPSGAVIGKIATPDAGRNCAFGDADMRTLYITAQNTLYSIRLKSPGIGA